MEKRSANESSRNRVPLQLWTPWAGLLLALWLGALGGWPAVVAVGCCAVLKKLRPRILPLMLAATLGAYASKADLLHMEPPDGVAHHWTCWIQTAATPQWNDWEAEAICSCKSRELPAQRVVLHSHEEPLAGDLVSCFAVWSAWKDTPHFAEAAYRESMGFQARIEVVGSLQKMSHRHLAWPYERLVRTRTFIDGWIRQHVSLTVQPLAWALSTGDKGRIPSETRALFQEAGLSHLLAVSGYHVGLVALLPLWLIRHRRQSFRWAGLTLGLPICWMFVALCGFPVSAVRAALMASCYYLAQVLRHHRSPMHAWTLTAWIITLAAPFRLVHLGAQLSFVAVLGILLGMERLRRLPAPIAVSLSAQAATAPLALYVFKYFCWAFLLTNLLAGPVLFVWGVLWMTALWLHSPGLTRLCSMIMEHALHGLEWLCCNIPMGTEIPWPAAASVALGVAVSAWFWWGKNRWRYRLMSIALAVLPWTFVHLLDAPRSPHALQAIRSREPALGFENVTVVSSYEDLGRVEEGRAILLRQGGVTWDLASGLFLYRKEERSWEGTYKKKPCDVSWTWQGEGRVRWGEEEFYWAAWRPIIYFSSSEVSY